MSQNQEAPFNPSVPQFIHDEQVHWLLRDKTTGKIVAGHANKSKVKRLRDRTPNVEMERKSTIHYHITINGKRVFGSLCKEKVLAKLEEMVSKNLV